MSDQFAKYVKPNTPTWSSASEPVTAEPVWSEYWSDWDAAVEAAAKEVEYQGEPIIASHVRRLKRSANPPVQPTEPVDVPADVRAFVESLEWPNRHWKRQGNGMPRRALYADEVKAFAVKAITAWIKAQDEGRV